MKYSIIIIAVGVTISIIIGAFLFWPKYQEFNGLQDELAEKNIELENQNKYMQKLLEIEGKKKEKQELVNKVNNALPIGSDIPSLLNFLQETSIRTGMGLEAVSWQELSSSNKEKKGRIKEYSISLELSGSYFAFNNFLFSLERSSRLIDVIESEFSISEEENEPIPFDIVLRVYSY